MDGRGVVQLTAEQQLRGKAFTHLKHLEPERNILRGMATLLCETLESMLPFPPHPRPLIIFHTGADRVQQRLVDAVGTAA